MTSNLAESAIAEMWANGLNPTVADIVRLNALGLRVERGESMTDFAAVPRHSFLGEYILTEPSLAVRIWLDEAASIFGDDYFSRLSLTAYALNTPSAELPRLDNSRKVREAVETFRDDVLIQFTETEIAAAVDFALVGGSSDACESAAPSKNELEAAKNAVETPREIRSYARTLLARAARSGLDTAFARWETVRSLEAIIANAVISRGGSEVAKYMRDDAVGEFYRTADAINERLMEERDGKTEH